MPDKTPVFYIIYCVSVLIQNLAILKHKEAFARDKIHHCVLLRIKKYFRVILSYLESTIKKITQFFYFCLEEFSKIIHILRF